MLEVGHIAEIEDLIVKALSPEWQPAESRFQDAIANLRVAIHQASAEESSNGSHSSPWVTRASTEERITPHIAIARIACGKAVVNYAQPMILGRCPDRLHIRMINRIINW